MAMAKRLYDFEKLRNSLHELQMCAGRYEESEHTLITQIDEVRQNMEILFKDEESLSKLQKGIYDLHLQAEGMIGEIRDVVEDILLALERYDTVAVYAAPESMNGWSIDDVL